VGCTCGHHPQGKLPPEEQRQKALKRDAARDRRTYNLRRYWADPEAHRAERLHRRAADPVHALEIERRSREKTRANRNARARGEVNVRKRLRDTHGMTPEDWARMYAAQGGRCCYCERPLPEDGKQVHIDHDHTCTCGPSRTCQHCRRGLACQNCNFVVGNANDDPNRLEVIAANLRRLATEARTRINTKPVQAELFDINQAASRQSKESALWLLAKAWGVCSTASRRSRGTPARTGCP
jgi:Recombination endonuclease VII